MISKNRVCSLPLLAAACTAVMAGCTLDTAGLGLDETVPEGGLADVASSDISQPLPEAAAPDTSGSDAPDAGPDIQVPDGPAPDADVPDTIEAPDSPAEDAFDSSAEDVFEAEASDDAGEDAFESDAPEPPDAPAPVVESMTVAPDSLTVDRVRTGDGAVSADGALDAAFVVSLYGEPVGIVLISCDAAGAPSGGQEWDTYVGTATIPAEVGAGFVVGSSTWQLGVWEGAVPLNAGDGSLVPVPQGAHTLQLYAANSGFFVAGSHFRVVVELAGGQVLWGPVVTY